MFDPFMVRARPRPMKGSIAIQPKTGSVARAIYLIYSTLSNIYIYTYIYTSLSIYVYIIIIPPSKGPSLRAPWTDGPPAPRTDGPAAPAHGAGPGPGPAHERINSKGSLINIYIYIWPIMNIQAYAN